MSHTLTQRAGCAPPRVNLPYKVQATARYDPPRLPFQVHMVMEYPKAIVSLRSESARRLCAGSYAAPPPARDRVTLGWLPATHATWSPRHCYDPRGWRAPPPCLLSSRRPAVCGAGCRRAVGVSPVQKPHHVLCDDDDEILRSPYHLGRLVGRVQYDTAVAASVANRSVAEGTCPSAHLPKRELLGWIGIEERIPHLRGTGRWEAQV